LIIPFPLLLSKVLRVAPILIFSYHQEAIMPGGLRPPVEVIASWKINYINPETGGRYVVITTAVMLGLAYLAVVMRLWARFRLAKSAGIDDALIIFNMVFLSTIVPVLN
jgi:hypothetical protein